VTQPAPHPLFLGSEIYRRSTFGSQHPLAIPRVSTVIDLTRTLGWLPRTHYRTSPRARPAALHLFHTPAYVAALQQAEADQHVSDATRARHGLGTVSNPVFPEMYRRPATSAGGSLLATDLIASGGVAMNPGGGTHHGHSDRASGFCYLNDPVLAIRAFQRRGLRRVAYVDIDAHHCDGVEAALTGEDGVCLISVHEAKRWPFTGAIEDRAGGIAWNLPAPRGLNDTEFDLILNQMILPVVAAHRPQVIILQCGADAVEEDPLSRLSLTNWAHRATARALAGMAPRVLVLGGGGYNPWSVARAWTGVWATLIGADIPDRLPDDAQAVLRGLRWSRKAGRTPPDHWITTLADPPRPGPIRDDLRQSVATLAHRLRSAA